MRSTQTAYSVYILTNYNKTVLYTGVTNNLEVRIVEHFLQAGNPITFTGKYNVYFLLYYEDYKYVNEAITREKEIKGWTRVKKENLIKLMNPEFRFLNTDIFGKWPPDKI